MAVESWCSRAGMEADVAEPWCSRSLRWKPKKVEPWCSRALRWLPEIPLVHLAFLGGVLEGLSLNILNTSCFWTQGSAGSFVTCLLQQVQRQFASMGPGVRSLGPALPGGAVGGGGEAACVGAGQGGEDHPLADELLQEEEEVQLCGADGAVCSGRRRNEPTAGGGEEVTASGEGWVGTARIRAQRGLAGGARIILTTQKGKSLCLVFLENTKILQPQKKVVHDGVLEDDQEPWGARSWRGDEEDGAHESTILEER